MWALLKRLGRGFTWLWGQEKTQGEVKPIERFEAEHYVQSWELYGPLDEVSAEQLIDAEIDSDLRALQARDLGYEGKRYGQDDDSSVGTRTKSNWLGDEISDGEQDEGRHDSW